MLISCHLHQEVPENFPVDITPHQANPMLSAHSYITAQVLEKGTSGKAKHFYLEYGAFGGVALNREKDLHGSFICTADYFTGTPWENPEVHNA